MFAYTASLRENPDRRFDEAGCPEGYDLECERCGRPQRWIYRIGENPPWSGRFFASVTWVYVPRDDAAR